MVIIFIIFQILFGQNSIYFDGARAMEHLEYQCSFGPRFPGSKGHNDFADSLKIFLDKLTEMNLVFKDTILNPISKKEVVTSQAWAAKKRSRHPQPGQPRGIVTISFSFGRNMMSPSFFVKTRKPWS